MKLSRTIGFGREDLFENESELDEWEEELLEILDEAMDEITETYYLKKATDFYDYKDSHWCVYRLPQK